jgi:hypothetical protein
MAARNMPNLSVTILEKEQISTAFSLVQIAAPGVELERWLEFVCRQVQSGGGLIGISAADSSLHGLAAFRPDFCLRYGMTLRVELIVTLELSRSAPVRAALCEALEVIAGARGCSNLSMEVERRGYAEPDSPKARGWESLGLALSSVAFVKQLTSAERSPVPA